MRTLRFSISIAVAAGCGGTQTPPQPPAATSACSAEQVGISRNADELAAKAGDAGITEHLDKNFPGGLVAWVIPEEKYKDYILKPPAKKWGRPSASESYQFQFAGPIAVVRAKVNQTTTEDRHVLEEALGVTSGNLKGPIRLVTLDVRKSGVCVRLPTSEDPGATKCTTAEQKDCFKFGGFTSGGVPEIMIIDAPVDRTIDEPVP